MSFVPLFYIAALLEGSAFAAGFLSDVDLQRYYRSSSPYISNPYVTMGQTSVNVSRRYVAVGGGEGEGVMGGVVVSVRGGSGGECEARDWGKV